MSTRQQVMRPEPLGTAVGLELASHRLGKRVTVLSVVVSIVVGITAGYVAARIIDRPAAIEQPTRVDSQPGIQSYAWPHTQPYATHPDLTRGQAASADRWAAQAAAYLAVAEAREQDRQRALDAASDRWAGQAAQWLAIQQAQEEARERALQASADRWTGLAVEWLALQEAEGR